MQLGQGLSRRNPPEYLLLAQGVGYQNMVARGGYLIPDLKIQSAQADCMVFSHYVVRERQIVDHPLKLERGWAQDT